MKTKTKYICQILTLIYMLSISIFHISVDMEGYTFYYYFRSSLYGTIRLFLDLNQMSKCLFKDTRGLNTLLTSLICSRAYIILKVTDRCVIRHQDIYGYAK